MDDGSEELLTKVRDGHKCHWDNPMVCIFMSILVCSINRWPVSVMPSDTDLHFTFLLSALQGGKKESKQANSRVYKASEEAPESWQSKLDAPSWCLKARFVHPKPTLS